METTVPLVPLDVVTEHYAAAMSRGENAGVYKEYLRVLSVLKKHGHYDAVLTLKKYEEKGSRWNSQTTA